LKKNQNSFCSPFTFRPASSLWPTLPFLGTSLLYSAFWPKPAHPRPSPFLLPPTRVISAAGPHRATRCLPTRAMEPELNRCATSLNSPPSMGAARYPSFLPFKNSLSPLNVVHPLGSSPGPIKGTPSTLQPASPHTLLFSSPPRSVCRRTELGPLRFVSLSPGRIKPPLCPLFHR
jgi:hypothetical protein